MKCACVLFPLLFMLYFSLSLRIMLNFPCLLGTLSTLNTNKEFMLCTNIPLNILDGYDDVFDIAMDFSFIKYKCTELSGRQLDPILATLSCFRSNYFWGKKIWSYLGRPMQPWLVKLHRPFLSLVPFRLACSMYYYNGYDGASELQYGKCFLH